MNRFLGTNTESSIADTPPILKAHILAWPIAAACIAVLWIVLISGGDRHIKGETQVNDGRDRYECIDNGRYRLFLDDGMSVGVSLESDDISADFYPDDEQKTLFYFTRQRNGYYSIVSTYSWCYWSLREDGTLTMEKDFRGDEEQLWSVMYLGRDVYALVAYNGQKVFMKDGTFLTDLEQCSGLRFRGEDE